MKTILSFFTVIFSAFILAQEYFPLLNHDNIWFMGVDELVTIPPGGDAAMEINCRLSNQVEIFNGKEFTALEMKERFIIDGNFGQWSEWEIKPFYLNEDITEQKVYIYYGPGTIDEPGEYLLYDFNLELGDEIPLSGFINGDSYNGNPDPLIITSIGYEDAYGIENLKTFHIEGTSLNFKIYEGIGSTLSLYALPRYLNDHWYLIDFSNTMSTTDIVSQKPIIYPNPFTNQIQIDTEKPIQQLQLFETTGKLITSKSTNSELNSNLSQLKPGVYILTITYKDHQKETVKLLKK